METLNSYLDALASDAPAPGGGSAATIVGAAGAALVAMVARINAKSSKHAADAPLCRELIRAADGIREALLQARRRDEAAFSAVVAAQGLPKASAQEQDARRAALETALAIAAEEPLRAGRLCLQLLSLTQRSLAVPNRNLSSDLGCAAEFALAALRACAYNVRVNHRFMHDRETIDTQSQQLERYEREATALAQSIRRTI